MCIDTIISFSPGLNCKRRTKRVTIMVKCHTIVTSEVTYLLSRLNLTANVIMVCNCNSKRNDNSIEVVELYTWFFVARTYEYETLTSSNLGKLSVSTITESRT